MGTTYSAARGLLVAALAGDLEGNIVRGVALDLDGAGGQVVKVLVEKLLRKHCQHCRPPSREVQKCRSRQIWSISSSTKTKDAWSHLRRWTPWRYRRKRE